MLKDTGRLQHHTRVAGWLRTLQTEKSDSKPGARNACEPHQPAASPPWSTGEPHQAATSSSWSIAERLERAPAKRSASAIRTVDIMMQSIEAARAGDLEPATRTLEELTHCGKPQVLAAYVRMLERVQQEQWRVHSEFHLHDEAAHSTCDSVGSSRECHPARHDSNVQGGEACGGFLNVEYEHPNHLQHATKETLLTPTSVVAHEISPFGVFVSSASCPPPRVQLHCPGLHLMPASSDRRQASTEY